MKQSDKFMINTGVLLLAYAYAVQNWTAPAVWFSFWALILALAFHSANSLRRQILKITVMVAFTQFLIHSAGIDEAYPSMVMVSIVGCITAGVWYESSRKAIRRVMHYLMYVLIISAAIMLGSASRLDPDGRGIIMVLIIYLPFLAVWTIKCMTCRKSHINVLKQRIMDRNCGGLIADDRFAGKVVH